MRKTFSFHSFNPSFISIRQTINHFTPFFDVLVLCISQYGLQFLGFEPTQQDSLLFYIQIPVNACQL